jgi:ribosome-binding protein aMBF1 (putative translation factor)
MIEFQYVSFWRQKNAEGGRLNYCKSCHSAGAESRLLPSESRRTELLKKKSFFLVAPNELDEDRLSGRELLENYKGQSKEERSFRFLKDPRFVAFTLFL